MIKIEDNNGKYQFSDLVDVKNVNDLPRYENTNEIIKEENAKEKNDMIHKCLNSSVNISANICNIRGVTVYTKSKKKIYLEYGCPVTMIGFERDLCKISIDGIIALIDKKHLSFDI